MNDHRKDSLYLDFSTMPARPKLETVYALLTTKINLDMTKVNCIQPSMSKARVIIELKSQAYVEELVAEHSLKHFVEHNNQQYPVPLVPFDNAIEVKVADMPSYVSTETIVKHLSTYGEVLSAKNELWKDFWPGLPTGIRLVRMRIQKPIPSYISIGAYTAFIAYRNQTRTCRYCVRPLHIGRTCNEVRKEMGIDINSRLTAAQVVQGMLPTPASITTNDQSPSSNASNTTNPMEPTTESESSSSAMSAIPGHVIVATEEKTKRTRSASRLPLGNSQVAGPSRTSSPFSAKQLSDLSSQSVASDFVISDDGDDTTMSTVPPKRHRSPKSTTEIEPPFVEVKRKSRSRTNTASSSR
ncbi:hypothetical protein RP20_CCG003179 [Aedes albopictus]|nr:hypothetical protein RP20_CCG003179 [Aedes albopictus]